MAAGDVSWTEIGASASGGTLFLDPAVGSQLKATIEKYRDGLVEMNSQLGMINRMTGFGGFRSSEQLAKKFAEKASGGDDALDKRIREHFDRANEILDIINKSVANYEQTDEATRQKFSSI